jgi:uncharacterized protein YggE
MMAVGAAAFVGRNDPNTGGASAPDTSVVSTAPTGPGSVVVSRTITVSGEGKVTVKPDTASVDLGVSVDAPTASTALDRANSRAAVLITALKAAGVADDDIATSGLNIYARYDNGNTVSGYTASNSVTVTVRSIDRTGPVIDAAAKAAGDNVTISGVSFYVADTERVIAAARADAIGNAALRAGQFAGAAGAKVGAVLQISEVSVGSVAPVYYATDSASASGGAKSAAPTPIQTGTQDLSVSVTVVYALA